MTRAFHFLSIVLLSGCAVPKTPSHAQSPSAADTPPTPPAIPTQPIDPALTMSPRDIAMHAALIARENDWRCGPIVYQVLVDRFAPPSPQSLDEKRALYREPRILMSWDSPAQRGEKLPDLGVWSHEVEFWGGDLASLRAKLDHIQGIGADVLYLNPIHEAWTNHKYDALDWAAVSPEYGTRDDVIALATDLHARHMRLMLDGVFNHMGKNAPIFKQAMADPGSEYHDWFFIDPAYPHGYRAWFGSPNLPEVRLESPLVRARVWDDDDSVVRAYLREGVDGWRLDVAYDYGLVFLRQLTEAAHDEKPGSCVIGEVWNYPEEWCVGPDPAMDGVMNMYARRLIMEFLDGKITGGRMGRMLDEMTRDMGIDAALRSWMVLDNHDTPRLKTMFPKASERRLAQIMQFTLPGAPVIYYGVEAGMVGDADPEMRGPMDWDAIDAGNPELERLIQLVALRRAHRALRYGDLRVLETEKLLAYQRRTDRAMETTTILINPTGRAITELISLRDSKFMNAMPLRDALTGAEVFAHTGTVEATIPARGAMILIPTDDTNAKGGYSPYKRMH